MATNDFSKTAVYESLSAINHATGQITEHIERLKSAYRLKHKMADLFRATAEELRAQINHCVTSNLSPEEQRHAAHYRGKRMEHEKGLAGG